MKKRVLITGGFGYLGGRIATELASNAEWKIRLGSRKDQPAPSWLPSVEMAIMDVVETHSLSTALADVHTVVHLAAMNEHESIADPRKAILINTLGTFNVLQAAIAAGAKQFIYFSTAHVYGAPLVGNITEQTLPRPTHPYAMTHHAAEDYVLAARDHGEINGIVVRLSNGFGAPTHPDVERWTLLVNDLCRQAVQTHKMKLHTSGLQQRDFITLSDVGSAVSHFLEMSMEQCGDGLFNLGGDASMSIIEMAQLIAARCKVTLGFHPEISYPAPALNERTRLLQYNCGKLQKTGFRLSGSIERELDNTLLLCMKAWGKSMP